MHLLEVEFKYCQTTHTTFDVYFISSMNIKELHGSDHSKHIGYENGGPYMISKEALIWNACFILVKNVKSGILVVILLFM